MKKTLLWITLLLASFNLFAVTAYKIKVDAINLKETGDFDFWGGKGDIQIGLMTSSGALNLIDGMVHIADNSGPIKVDNALSVYLPSESIQGKLVQIRLEVIDKDDSYNDTILTLNQRFELSKERIRLEKQHTGEYVDLSIEKVEMDLPAEQYKELEMKSLNLVKISQELNEIVVSSSTVKKNSTAMSNGAKNFEMMYRLRERILRNEGGEGYIRLVEKYNDVVFNIAEKVITATDWANEQFPALPNASSLLIYRE